MSVWIHNAKNYSRALKCVSVPGEYGEEEDDITSPEHRTAVDDFKGLCQTVHSGTPDSKER